MATRSIPTVSYIPSSWAIISFVPTPSVVESIIGFLYFFVSIAIPPANPPMLLDTALDLREPMKLANLSPLSMLTPASSYDFTGMKSPYSVSSSKSLSKSNSGSASGTGFLPPSSFSKIMASLSFLFFLRARETSSISSLLALSNSLRS